jgi:biotin operon repressor
MRPLKINDHKLLRLIDKKKMPQTKAAKELGVSRQAVSRRLQEIRGKTTRVIVAKKVEQVVDRKIDAMDQLIRIYDFLRFPDPIYPGSPSGSWRPTLLNVRTPPKILRQMQLF